VVTTAIRKDNRAMREEVRNTQKSHEGGAVAGKGGEGDKEASRKQGKRETGTAGDGNPHRGGIPI